MEPFLLIAAVSSFISMLILLSAIIVVWKRGPHLIMSGLKSFAKNQQMAAIGVKGGIASGISKHTKEYKQQILQGVADNVPFMSIIKQFADIDSMLAEDPDAVIALLTDPGIQKLIEFGLNFVQTQGPAVIQGLIQGAQQAAAPKTDGGQVNAGTTKGYY